MVLPSTSRRQSGVMVVPQLWHATTTVVLVGAKSREAPFAEGEGEFAGEGPAPAQLTVNCADFATRLLYAGHPLHPSAPPVPLHLPPPGHVPSPASTVT